MKIPNKLKQEIKRSTERSNDNSKSPFCKEEYFIDYIIEKHENICWEIQKDEKEKL